MFSTVLRTPNGFITCESSSCNSMGKQIWRYDLGVYFRLLEAQSNTKVPVRCLGDRAEHWLLVFRSQENDKKNDHSASFPLAMAGTQQLVSVPEVKWVVHWRLSSKMDIRTILLKWYTNVLHQSDVKLVAVYCFFRWEDTLIRRFGCDTAMHRYRDYDVPLIHGYANIATAIRQWWYTDGI